MKKIATAASILLGVLILFGQSFAEAEKKEEKREYRGEYRSPAWMDNEHIICVRYTDEVKKRLFDWFGDLTDARYIVVKEEIQFVSMDINGENEKLLKSIIIDYPGQSPKWREDVFKGTMRVDQIAYCPQRKLIVFSTHGFTEAVYMINADGTGAKRIAEVGGGMYFSPDGKYLQYTSKYKVWLYDLDTGEQKVLIEDAVSGPWSPDGKKVFFSRKIDKNYNVFLYDLETKQEEKVDIHFSFGYEWPEDCRVDYGRILEKREIRPEGKSTYRYEIIISDMTEKGIVEKTNLGEMKSVIWGDDRNTLIHVKDDYFWKFDIESGVNKKLFKSFYIDGFLVERLYPMKCLDNERLLVNDRWGGLSIYDLKNCEKTAGSKERFSFLFYSPDRTKILANTEQGLCVVEINTLQYKQLLKEQVYAY